MRSSAPVARPLALGAKETGVFTSTGRCSLLIASLFLSETRSKASHEWRLQEGGEVLAAGVGRSGTVTLQQGEAARGLPGTPRAGGASEQEPDVGLGCGLCGPLCLAGCHRASV